jgi:hypothetical protein
MVRTLIDRRAFLRSAGLAFVAGLAPRGAEALELSDAVYAAAFRAPDGSYGIATLGERGEVIDSHSLPARSHGLAFSPASGHVAAFARRPGTFAAIFSGNSDPVVISAAEGRHFFGHGCFSADGRLLYASENDFDNNTGMIGIYDATSDYRRIGTFPAFGIGTHDLAISADGRTLIAANGGIRTHPDFGRTKLNLDRMEPSMALIDAGHGALVEKHELPGSLRQLSTRHAAVDADGAIWFACQYEGSAADRPPLVGHFARGEAIAFIELPEPAASMMANYVGAIAINRAEGLVAVTSPKGGAVVVLDGRSGTLVSANRLAGASGVAAARSGFAVSTETGRFIDRTGQRAWDQHIVPVS